MAARSRPGIGAFPNSRYAAELQGGAARRSFGPEVEAEYLRAHLSDNRTLIRMACAFAVLLGVFRGLDQLVFGVWDQMQPILVVSVVGISIALCALAWTPAFGRFYLPVARAAVPIRNVLVAVCVTQVAAQGALESLMLLPLLVIGPFFFMGLQLRAALLAVVATMVSFAVVAAILGLSPPVAARAFMFLLITAVSCAFAARHLETWSRTSFLEGHLIQELAQHDTLTGLKNRRIFDEHLDRLWSQAIEDARTLAILMVDIDHFKAYNDRYGHQAGDHALRRVAQTLQPLVSRPCDVLARYGGEEFAVILYDIESRQAEELAERMRRAVGELAIEHQGAQAGAVTISVGVAIVGPSRDRRSRGALQLADQALYEAKVRGRNRVEVMDDAAHRLLVTGVFSKASLARR